MMRRGEKSYPYQDSKTNPSAVQPIASRYTDCAIPEESNCSIISVPFTAKISVQIPI
jgi:hypothetical protein